MFGIVVGLFSGTGNLPVADSIVTPLQLPLLHSNRSVVKGI